MRLVRYRAKCRHHCAKAATIVILLSKIDAKVVCDSTNLVNTRSGIASIANVTIASFRDQIKTKFL